METNTANRQIEGVVRMDVIKVLQSLPGVSIEEKSLTTILETSPLEYGKVNWRFFASQLEQLAYYSIEKGDSKGDLLYLYIDAWFDNEDTPTETQGVFFGIQQVGENGGDSHGTFDTLEEAVKEFKKMVFKFENLSVYRVYDAKLKDEDTPIRFAVSTIREVSFRQEIEQGLLMIELDSLSLFLETEDRNQARALAPEF